MNDTNGHQRWISEPGNSMLLSDIEAAVAPSMFQWKSIAKEWLPPVPRARSVIGCAIIALVKFSEEGEEYTHCHWVCGL